jgi:hypothetical protein
MKIKFLLLGLFSIIFLAALAQASVTQNNYFRYGIIEQDGSLTITSTDIQGVYTRGYVCSNFDCSTLGSLVISNYSSSSSTKLTFPTTLQGQGYGLYFYKNGYIPYEVKSTFAGSGQAPDSIRYLTRKRVCTSEVTLDSLNFDQNSLTVLAHFTSPVNNSGPLAAVPQVIDYQYQTVVNSSLELIGPTNMVTSQLITNDFSTLSNVEFTVPLSSLAPGDYEVRVTATPRDNNCLSTQTSLQTTTLTVPSNGDDTTAPGQITNLHVVSITNTTLTWAWTNPTDPDFNLAIISFDGTNSVNTSASSFSSTEVTQTLAPGSTHTISITTRDITGNVNTNAVSDTQTTLTNSNQTNNQTGAVAIRIVSPQEAVYNVPNIPINLFAENATNVWFSINNGQNTTYTSPTSIYLVNGSYTIRAFASNSISNASAILSFSINTAANATNTTTLPGQVSGLRPYRVGSDFIQWIWTNPGGSFYQAIIFIDGENVLNTTGNSYTASDLLPEEVYTISIMTKDLAGNVNTNPVSDSTRTIADTNNDDDEEDDDDSGSTRGQTFSLDLSTDEQDSLNISTEPIKISSEKSEPVSLWPFVILLIVSCILLAILIVILLQR